MLRLIDVQQSILRKNTTLATELRADFARRGTFVFNLLSSPGAGKTTLLEQTLTRLRENCRAGALVGDQATDNDALRLGRSGAPVKQITTGAECRLDAQMITAALRDAATQGFDDLDVLAIENVGNLICPAEYDLGEDLRVVLFSVTEGEDKPRKYPLAFTTAQVAIITKIDLAPATGFDRECALANILLANPALEGNILELSARSGRGVDEWMEYLLGRIAAKRALVEVP